MTPRHMLVIDDDAVDRRLVRRALRDSGLDCEVQEADCVEAMRDACDAQAFDCAIIDYRLPGVSGLDGIDELRRLAPGLPIVMVTGQGDEMVAREALYRGAADYIPKSALDPATMRRTVERAIEGASLRRRLERQRAELESFARVLVHDLSAPISSTCLAASMIKESVADGDAARAARYCDQVIALGESMRALMSDLHAHTRLDEHPDFAPFALREAYDDAVRNLEAELKNRGADVRCAPLPHSIGSRAQITQLLQNLISNGVKYCAAARPEVHVSAECEGSALRISVADNGVGVPEEYRAKIFEPFQRLHTRDEYPGVGLGLATCLKIVERHNGEIWCEDNPSGGSIFHVALPAEAPAIG